jgi:hypothetical protein
LDIDDQKQQGPPDRRPVDANAIPRINHVAQTLEQLRHAQAENDGENDSEITELIHAAASALSLDKTSVDNGSLRHDGRSKAALHVDRLFLNSDVRSITITSMSMSVTMSSLFVLRHSSFACRAAA